MMMLFKGFRSVAATLACATMILSPMAEGSKAEADRQQQLKEFLKDSGLDQANNLTVGDFYLRIKEKLPADLRQQMRPWLMAHRADMMPKVDTSVVKDNKGIEQLRMLFTQGKESFSVTTGDGFIQFGSKKLTAKDFADPRKTLATLAVKDNYFKKILERAKPVPTIKLNVVPSLNEFANYNGAQRAQYFLQLRYLLEEAQTVMRSKYGNDFVQDEKIRRSYDVVMNFVMGEEARAQEETLLPPGEIPPKSDGSQVETEKPKTQTAPTPPRRPKKAANAAAAASDDPITERTLRVPLNKSPDKQIPAPGESCIVAGYMTRYDEKAKSCGGPQAGAADWKNKIDAVKNVFPNLQSCGSGSFPCNPMVYGFASGSTPHCIQIGEKREEIRFATRECGKASPAHGERDFENAKRIVNSWLNAHGKPKIKARADGLIDPSDYARVKEQIDDLNAYIDKAVAHCESERGLKISDKLINQKSACEEIKKRKLGLQAWLLESSQGDGATRCSGIPGASFNPASKRCECAASCAPPVLSGGRETCSVPVEIPAGGETVEEKSTNWWPWIIGGTLLAGGILCIAWLCKDKKRPPVYIPPTITPPTPLPPPTPEPPTPPPTTPTTPTTPPTTPTTPTPPVKTEYTTTPVSAPIDSGGKR